MNMVWAFHGPSNLGPNSWLLLLRNDVESGVILLSIQSKKCTAETCMQPGKLVEETRKMLHIPGFDNMMIYITEHRPLHGELAAKFPVPN